FQAEDGIRDRNVTGVQTCALPISDVARRAGGELVERLAVGGRERVELRLPLGRRVEVAPRGDIQLEEGRAEDLREGPLPGAPEDLHLEEPVLCLDVAVGEEQVVEVRGEDVRHAVGVAQHRRGQRRERIAHGLAESHAGRHDEGEGRNRLPHGYLRLRRVRWNVRFCAAWSLPISIRTWTLRSVVPSKVERSMLRPLTLTR